VAGAGVGWLACGVIRIYQLTLSPLQTIFFGAHSGCRFTPTCSAYAIEAIRMHGAAGGSLLAAKRICRCHPWGACGHDPVPAPPPGQLQPRGLNT
jgi:putative membrane protein insertion efficiency factor